MREQHTSSAAAPGLAAVGARGRGNVRSSARSLMWVRGLRWLPVLRLARFKTTGGRDGRRSAPRTQALRRSPPVVRILQQSTCTATNPAGPCRSAWCLSGCVLQGACLVPLMAVVVSKERQQLRSVWVCSDQVQQPPEDCSVGRHGPVPSRFKAGAPLAKVNENISERFKHISHKQAGLAGLNDPTAQ